MESSSAPPVSAPSLDASSPEPETAGTPREPADISGKGDAGELLATYGLRQSDRLFLIVLSSLIVLLIIIHLIRLSLPGAPAFQIDRLPSSAAEFRIDINQATWVEWMQLPGIGESLARQIVVNRDEQGPFQSLDDVSRVRGIGPVKMENIRPFLKLAEEDISPSRSADNAR